MKLLKTKKQLTSHIEKVFNNESFISFLNSHLVKTENQERAFSKFLGNFLYYTVATRSTSIEKDVVLKLFEWETYTTFLSGKEIVKELASQIEFENKQPTIEAVLKRFKKNFVDNGLYMHAFNSAFKPHIEEHGANVRKELDFNESKKRITTYIEYPYDTKSYRFFVSGKYEVLYGYGSKSPEWFYNLVKNSEVFYTKDYRKATKLIVQNIMERNPKMDKEYLKVLSQDAEIISKSLLNKKNTINIAVVERNLKTESGQRVFPEYLEEDTFEDNHFTVQSLYQFLDQNGKQLSLSNNARDCAEELGAYINKIICNYTLYETSTHHAINPEHIEIIQLPPVQKLKLKPIEKESSF